MIPETSAGAERDLDGLVTDFLTDLANANRPATTQRAYGADLASFARFHEGQAAAITPEILRAFLSTRANLAPATRARTQAALSSFLAWAYRHNLIDANPMGKIERVKLDSPRPRVFPGSRSKPSCPASPPGSRLLFRLLAETGLRPGEVLGLHIEDLDMTADDEHLSVLGKGGRRRTVLLDDPGLVKDLRTYLKRTGYRHGPLFLAEKNGPRGSPSLSVHPGAVGAVLRAAAGVVCTLHQLRHSHATELVNDGVSLATIRKRLGHKNLQTTLRYGEQSDAAADAELRAWRRKTPWLMKGAHAECIGDERTPVADRRPDPPALAVLPDDVWGLPGGSSSTRFPSATLGCSAWRWPSFAERGWSLPATFVASSTGCGPASGAGPTGLSSPPRAAEARCCWRWRPSTRRRRPRRAGSWTSPSSALPTGGRADSVNVKKGAIHE